MHWITRFIFISLISVGLAWMLSFMPSLELAQSAKNNVLSVFHTHRPVQLEEDNLVDYISGISLNLDITKVDWDHATLYIDLKLDPSSAVKHPLVLEDLAEIAKFGLFETLNVNQVMIRVIDPVDSERKGELLLAMDARREELTEGDLVLLKATKGNIEESIRNKFHLTFTKLWFSKLES